MKTDFLLEQALSIATDIFGLRVKTGKRLASERDQNFLIVDNEDRQFVLKLYNAAESRNFLEGQNAMLRHLSERNIACPRLVKSVNGESIQTVPKDGREHFVRLLTFLPGKILADLNYVSMELLNDLGRRLAEMNNSLADFHHEAFHRNFHWDLANAEQVICDRIELIDDHRLRELIELFTLRFRQHTLPILEFLPKSIIHNDANDGNIVADRINQDQHDQIHSHCINGFIDFGDAVYTWTIADLAIATAYAMLKQSDPMAMAKTMVRSYDAVRPITQHEAAALFGLICMRLCSSVSIAAEQIKAQPDNEYLAISQEPIRETLPKLINISFEFAESFFRTAIDLPAIPDTNPVLDWLQENHAVFPFPVNPQQAGVRPTSEQTLVLDLGVESHLIPSDIDSVTESDLTEIVFGQAKRHDATVVIGRYLEPRVLYSSRHFVGEDLADESRTVHLGIDIFAPAGTDVVAPLDGTVQYCGVIDKPLDYGGLVILKHTSVPGHEFFTLYGHLDPSSFESLTIGQLISTGEKFAELGAPEVNGGWTPHVHFQLILDLLGLGHKFPGVAHASQIETWSAVSPDPNLILGIDGCCFPKPTFEKRETLSRRRAMIGPNLSVGYIDPLKIVRGWKQYLFDETGRRYLDAYNNVPHVGHCHPKVVKAVATQMSLLNTNTRYLHDNINELAVRLAGTMPDGLEVCYFLNSGSEANELALRLARQYTTARDMIVLEAAYHGHSTTLIDLSPYKHDGPGGSGPPDWVHVVPLADVYRGKYRDPKTATADYSSEVAETLAGLDQKLCGFISESCPSVGGQILFPAGYLAAVYEVVRAAGGVCIADDVQTGYGRLGSHMYGFEMQGVKPDIVVLGKPIGNGHPLAAVVTTREIADAFDNGMEFFSTFGGNPVSCAAGLAVLDVLQDEQLQKNAAVVGNRLLIGLRELQQEFAVIGDVRGRGFFLGVELVRNQESKEPAISEANFISNDCRQLGVLIGTDGPFHNVLKIRPPMCFDEENAIELLRQLRRALEKLEH